MTRRILFLLIVALAVAPFLAGDVVWLLGGANRLTIEGSADLIPVAEPPGNLGAGWPAYGGDSGGHRYSRAAQVTPANVASLETAWSFSTGDLAAHPDAIAKSAAEGTPILTDDALVFCTPFNEVIALDPDTGTVKWRFDPEINLDHDPANQFVCRGVAHWRGESVSGVCSQRIFMGTNDARLIAVDAASGRPCPGFGVDGEVAIAPGMELWWPGEFQITSPPVTINDVVVVGSAIGDNARVRAPRGVVRAFDAISGELLWHFDPIPRGPSDPGRSTWPAAGTPAEGHANVWAPMSVDAARGLIFLPTSSPSPDFFGGLREGDNRYANSVVALNAQTGVLQWAFQTVHHDVWDYDLPAQPGLYRVWKDGEHHEVVAQATKTGMVFVLDRDNGKPFLPVAERPVPQAAISGEHLSLTQPFTHSPALVPHSVSTDDAFGVTWFDKQFCKEAIKSAVAGSIFTPPSETGTLISPFTGGGANWGGTAFDPQRNLLVVNVNNLVHKITLIPSADIKEARRVYHDQEVSPQVGAPFGMKRELLMSPLGLPCNRPPWGLLVGVDLASGDIVWRRPLGSTEDLAPGPAITLGTPSFGGPIITAGGLTFIAAAMDNYLRAFDTATGKALWKGRLPAGAQATPMTYEWKGRQYVVIYAGGHSRAGTTLGDTLVAFALPDLR